MFNIQRIITQLPFFFPLYLVRFSIFNIPSTLLEVVTWLLAGFFFWKNFQKIPRMIVKNRWTLLLAGFFLLAVLLTIFLKAPAELAFFDGSRERLEPTWRLALGQFKGVVLTPLVFFTLLLNLNRPNKEKIWQNFFWAAAILAAFSIGMIFFKKGLTYDFRLAGPFTSANYLALFLGPALAGLSSYIFKGKIFTKKKYLF